MTAISLIALTLLVIGWSAACVAFFVWLFGPGPSVEKLLERDRKERYRRAVIKHNLERL